MTHSIGRVHSGSAAVALVVGLCAAMAPAPAQACWDGYLASSSRVVIAESSNPSPPWKPETARDLARWLARLEALLPAGYRVEVWDGIVDICRAAADQHMDYSMCLGHDYWSRKSFPSLFRLVARLVRARPAVVLPARSRDAAPLTVQLAAGYDERGARAIARRLNRQRPVDHGFYEAGGFPADNDLAHVVTEESAAGSIYRVWVGAFLARGEAQAALAKVRAATGMTGFVRPL